MPVLAACFCGNGHAQTVFDAHYAVGYNNIGWVRGVGTPTGGLMVSARPLGDSIPHFESAVLTTDLAGNVMSLLRYEHGGSDQISCMARSTDGKVAMGSLTRGHFGLPDAADILVRMVLADGDLGWAKAYAVDGQYNADLYDLVESAPGIFTGIGSISQADGAASPLVFQFSGNSDIIWASGLSTTVGALQFLRLTVDPAGGVIASGQYADEPDGSKMAIVHLDGEGGLDWAHWYGTSGYGHATSTVVRPTGGFAVIGSMGGLDTLDGAVVRINADGTPTSMFAWGSEGQDGQCFNDGSIMVVCDGGAGGTAIARIDTGNVILWSTLLGAAPSGELVPVGGNGQFAYVSSEMFSDVTINTITEQCEGCNDDPVPYTTVTEIWADNGPLEVSIEPLTMSSMDIPMTTVPLSTIMAPQCILNVGVGAMAWPGPSQLICAYGVADHGLSLAPPPPTGTLVVSDILGRQWRYEQHMYQGTAGGATRVVLPQDLAPGAYMARCLPGTAACKFIVPRAP